MKKLYLGIFLFTLALSDILMINMSHFLGYFLANKYLVDVDQNVYLANALGFSIIWLFSSAICKLYTPSRIRKLDIFFISTSASIGIYIALLSIYLFLTQAPFPVEFLASVIPLLGMSFSLSRFTAKALKDLLPHAVIEKLIRNIKSPNAWTASA